MAGTGPAMTSRVEAVGISKKDSSVACCPIEGRRDDFSVIPRRGEHACRDPRILSAGAPEEAAPNEKPVKVVAGALITIRTAAGTGILPGYVSRDWSQPQPEITRAVLVFHGRLRNADVYWRSAQEAQAAAGAAQQTLMIVPQFLADDDVRAHASPVDFLHWSPAGWEGGASAHGPIAISSFEAIDAILARLADRSLFPNLTTVVVAGHSGGGQVVQRYAVVGRGEAAGRSRLCPGLEPAAL